MTLLALALSAALVGAEPVPAETPTLPEPVAPPAGVLTLEQAVKRALETNPTTAAAEAREDAAKARVRQAKSALRPQLDGSASAGVSGSEPPDFAGPNPVIQAGLSLNWLLIDFGRTSEIIQAQRLSVAVAHTAIDTTHQALIAQVEVTYFEGVARRRLADVLRASVEAEERHVRDADRLVKVGVRPAFDAAQAKTRLAVAKTQLARAEGDYRVAITRLALAIGGGSLQGVELSSTWPGAEPGEDGPIEALMTEAMANRADAQSFELTKRVADQSIVVAEQGLTPSLGLNARIGVQGQEDPSDNNDFGFGAGWSATVALNWPFLDGGLTAAQVDEARAQRREIDATYAQFEIGVRADIESSQVAIASAKQQYEAAIASQEIAREALRLAEARYRQGLSSGVELADAQSNLVLVGADVVTAEWTLASARASLRASVGRGLR